MKKLTAILLCLTMLFALVACGNGEDKSNTNNNSSNNNTENNNTENGDTANNDSSTNNDNTANNDTDNGDVGSAEKGGKLGAILPSLSFDFQLQMNNGIQRAADEFGYEYQAYDYNFDNELMLSGLDTLKASNVKAMYAIFLAPESAASFMEENPDIGVLSQGGVSPGALAGTINDYVMLGTQFVDSLDNYVKENNIASGNIGALWLTTCENQDSEYYQAMLDIKGQIEAWCEGKDFAFTADYYPNDDEEAANMTAQMLNADPDLKFVFCFNNGFAIAASNEIASAVADTAEYFVFSSEGDVESFRLIASGDSPYRGCAYMDIEASGYSVGLQLINWIENGQMENVVVEKILIDGRNVAEYTN